MLLILISELQMTDCMLHVNLLLGFMLQRANILLIKIWLDTRSKDIHVYLHTKFVDS